MGKSVDLKGRLVNPIRAFDASSVPWILTSAALRSTSHSARGRASSSSAGCLLCEYGKKSSSPTLPNHTQKLEKSSLAAGFEYIKNER